MTPFFDDILPPPAGLDGGDLEQLHERAYIVRSYRNGPTGLVLRGAVRDQKPAGWGRMSSKKGVIAFLVIGGVIGGDRGDDDRTWGSPIAGQ